MIAPNIILPFDGNHADVPSGFTRETTLDSKYIKGTADATDPNDTGGATTHTHTGTGSHTHTLASHTHSGTSGNTSAGYSTTTGGSGGNLVTAVHTHNFTTGARSGGTTNATTANYGSVSNDPPYYTVIFIKSTGYSTIPNNAMVFSASTTRTDFDFHTGSANKFLKGASTGANAGSTGGSTQNVHSISHTHTTNTHTHANSSTGYPNQSATVLSEAVSNDDTRQNHTHTVSVNASTQNINAYSGNLTTTETVQPAYTTLNAFKNESGSGKMPAVGDIAMWLGSLASIPPGWKICDGNNDTPDMRGRYYKNNASATTSSTGGSNTHTHAAQGHSHTGNGSHSHTASFASYSDTSHNKGDGVNTLQGSHTHDSVSVSSTVNYDSANTSADSASNEPEYRTVAFIQFEFPPVMPNPILKMLIDTVENWG